MFRPTMIACPSCNCHAVATEPTCPHCGAALRIATGATDRTAASALLGLAMAFGLPAGAVGCNDPVEPEVSNASSSSTGFETVSAYGIAVTSSGGGEGGAVGQGGAGQGGAGQGGAGQGGAGQGGAGQGGAGGK